jgi:hypothetical protein
MTGFGPLFQLQVKGFLCPCLERSENKNARQAVAAINGACKRILWHRQPSSQRKSAGFSLSFTGFFQRSSIQQQQQQQATDTDGNDAEVMELVGPSTCLAKLILRDSGGDRHQPELFLDPIFNADTKNDDNRGTFNNNQNSISKLNIKLRRVDTVRLDEETGQIVLLAKKSSGQPTAKELLRFTVLQPMSEQNHDWDDSNSRETIPATSDARNLLMHHFMVIVEWERLRRAEIYDWDDDDDDENQLNFIQARAQKAAHFAKREIEMKQTKKSREERKAKLIAESGGLKYTAIAMANMQST